jgi:hypothetical protein
MGRDRDAFMRVFEGKSLLDDLLAVAGSPLSTEMVIDRFQEAKEQGAEPSEVIPALLPHAPRFPDPQVAQRLFQNLLGLWDLVVSGEPIPLQSESRPRDRPVKREPAKPPGPFGEEGPDTAWAEAAWRYLEDLDKRGLERLQHAFENRQDALLGLLDEQDLPENAYASARYLLFELCTMVELGGGGPLRGVSAKELKAGAEGAVVPAALESYAEEALSEAELDEEEPLSPDEAKRVRELVKTALGAIWNARPSPTKQ